MTHKTALWKLTDREDNPLNIINEIYADRVIEEGGLHKKIKKQRKEIKELKKRITELEWKCDSTRWGV